MTLIMLNLFFLIFLALWSLGVGRSLLWWSGRRTPGGVEDMAVSLPLGLGVLATAVFGLAEIGRATPLVISIVLAIGFWPALRGLGRLCSCASIPPIMKDVITPALLVALSVAGAGSLFVALSPVTDGDALCYHLQVSKRILEGGQAFFDPDLHESVYPLTTEMLYVVGLALRGPQACRLIQWLFGLSLFFSTWALATPILGRFGLMAGAIAILVPAVSNGMSAPLSDVSLAAFGITAILAWDRWRQNRSVGAAILTGVFTGFAIGVKYPGLVLAGLIGIAMSLESIARRDRRSLLGVCAFAAAVVAIGGCWYLRAFIHTGNPVYPFFRNTFGGSGLAEVLETSKRPLAVNPLNLLTALVPMTLEPDRFDSFSHQLGPIFLCLLPLLLIERAPRRLWALLGMGFAFLVLCLTERQSTRFVLISVGPFAVASAWVLDRWRNRPGLAAKALFIIMLLLLSFESIWSLARARRVTSVVLGNEPVNSYLSRVEPTFVVGRWVDGHLPPTARLIGQDHRGFYFPRPYTMELAHRRRTGLGGRGESASEIIAQLRKSHFTHLLLCPPIPESAVEFDPTLGRLLEPWMVTRRPIYRAELSDGDGVRRRYEIYELDSPSQGSIEP